MIFYWKSLLIKHKKHIVTEEWELYWLETSPFSAEALANIWIKLDSMGAGCEPMRN